MQNLLRLLRPGFLTCALFFAHSITSKAQDWEQVTKLVARYANGNAASIDNMTYGNAVSVSGNYAVVGAVNDGVDESGGNPMQSAGSAFILYNDGGIWKPLKKLTAPVRSLYGRFGCSVAISGDYMIVGESDERLDGSPKGSAYIFRKDQGGAGNWGLVKRLHARTRSSFDSFGLMVDISNDFVVVTSRYDDLDSGDGSFLDGSGAAFIFQKNLGGVENWGLVKKITTNVRAQYDYFGYAAAIDGDQLIVSAQGGSEAVSGGSTLSFSGAAYVFRRDQGGNNNWGQVKKITPAVRTDNDNFGVGVDISGDHIIVGASGEDEDANEQNSMNDAGAAYIFAKDKGGAGNWGQAKKLISNTRGYNGTYGESVGIGKDIAVVGGRRENMDAKQENYMYESGATYIYERNTGSENNWGLSAKLFPSTRVPSENFGIWVALDGKTLFVSSLGVAREPGDLSTVSFPGAVFVFKQLNSLPVTLASFEVSKIENQALLQWTTSAETNTAYFEVQKSLNARDWNPIGIIDAARESNRPLHYTHWDYNIGVGSIYYRLKMIDRAEDHQDGTFTFSSIRSLLSKDREALVVFPNPAVNRIFIKTTDFNKSSSIKVLNNAGQMVYEAAIANGEGISTGNFSAGIYYIQLRNVDGSIATQKITVNK
ncbi:T9SS type A sorting domain-containing protein [Dyadobacter arcticus]|uniref:Secretion system C-terminal sorting domain-containing protein n=1 Tax=Dyadobacter arcticus TaxID=1078754 RepID=A0ABX0UNN1_9BACT|nr:T9SS type A sorting domain-containing protein [Dyadobacter arcticus]NIJ54477.1 hypothetical protein [Dyadobacter arcticus]